MTEIKLSIKPKPQGLTSRKVREIQALWNDCPAGPWRESQLHGLGAKNFLITEAPDQKWLSVIAEFFQGPWNFHKAIANSREDVPALCRELLRAWDRIEELERERPERPTDK